LLALENGARFVPPDDVLQPREATADAAAGDHDMG
jgi:hypothetical protein